jgi:hypothetical protein
VNDCLGLLRRNHNTQRSIDVSCTHVLFAVQILICRKVSTRFIISGISKFVDRIKKFAQSSDLPAKHAHNS